MILLLTTEAGDYSHIELVNWLEYYKADYCVLTGESFLVGRSSLSISDNVIKINGKTITDDINVVYYRRWAYPSNIQLVSDKVLNKGLISNLFSESYQILHYLEKKLKNAVWIPNSSSISVNKINVLEEAKNIGLVTPRFIVSTKKNDLVDFCESCGGTVITKAIGNYEVLQTSDSYYSSPIYTKRVSTEQLLSLNDTVVPTLLQEEIEKSFELRIFFFDGVFFTTAIMSQSDVTTELDSRISSNGSFAKLVPYIIDDTLKSKLVALCENLSLNIGSIDMIVKPDGSFVFLEINPVGQITGYSTMTGRRVEKIIAEKLMEIDKEKNERRNDRRTSDGW